MLLSNPFSTSIEIKLIFSCFETQRVIDFYIFWQGYLSSIGIGTMAEIPKLCLTITRPFRRWNRIQFANESLFVWLKIVKKNIWAIVFVLELDSSWYRRQKWIIIFGQNLAIPDIVWSMNVQNYVACNFHRGANVDKPSALSHYLLQWLLCKLFVHTNTRRVNLEIFGLQRKFVCSHKTCMGKSKYFFCLIGLESDRTYNLDFSFTSRKQPSLLRD